MENFIKKDLTDRLKLYLKKNNLKSSDIKNFNINFSNGHLFLNVDFKNNTSKHFRVFNYHLNKKGKLALGTTIVTLGAIGLMGSLGSYSFSENYEKIKLKPHVNNEIATVINSDEVNEDTVIDINKSDIATSPTYNIDNNEVSYEYINMNEYYNNEEVNSNIFHRDINIRGSEYPSITSYNYILETYYDQINTYGNRYGIDPSIIAALVMQETGTEDTEYYQTCYEALGLGKFNCKYFDNHVFHVYNFETNTYEDYTCTYEKLKNNRDEQIKIIAMQLQTNAIQYDGNLAATLICYNQGMGTVNKIIKNVMGNTNYSTKDDVLNANDAAILSKYNSFTLGDPGYFNKVVTFLNYELENQVFGNNVATIKLPGEDRVIEYGTNLKLAALKGAR